MHDRPQAKHRTNKKSHISLKPTEVASTCMLMVLKMRKNGYRQGIAKMGIVWV